MRTWVWGGVLSAACALGSAPAWGWGSYGHEQINSAALKAIEASPLGRCFKRNERMVVRLAITPDYEWKMLGTAPPDPEERRKRAAIDRQEHPLHFFEADAFVRHRDLTADAITRLPGGPFPRELPLYQDLLAANIEWVLTVDPAKRIADPRHPTKKEVTDHGTAPWRVRQLFELAVDALVAGDPQMALVYLGTLGHYVGDMSQPFHATLNYDGQYPSAITRGIHGIFESKILEFAAATVRAQMDRTTKLWSSFAATEPEVQAALRAAWSPNRVRPDDVVATTMRLVSTGHAYIDPLLASFATAVRAAQGPHRPPADPAHPEDPHAPKLASGQRHPTVPAAAARAFSSALLDAPGVPRGTVLHAANVRLGEGAALLAQLWSSAYEEARGRNAEVTKIADCTALDFTTATVLDHYPSPVYAR